MDGRAPSRPGRDALHHVAQGDLRGRSGCCRRGRYQAAGGQGSLRCRDHPQAPGPGIAGTARGSRPPARGSRGALRAAGPRSRARSPALAPPRGSLRTRHPALPEPPPATHRSQPPALLAAPEKRRLSRHRKRFSSQSGPARRRRLVRALGARPRAQGARPRGAPRSPPCPRFRCWLLPALGLRGQLPTSSSLPCEALSAQASAIAFRLGFPEGTAPYLIISLLPGSCRKSVATHSLTHLLT